MMDPLSAFLYFGLPTSVGLIGLAAVKLHERRCMRFDRELDDRLIAMQRVDELGPSSLHENGPPMEPAYLSSEEMRQHLQRMDEGVQSARRALEKVAASVRRAPNESIVERDAKTAEPG